MNVDVRVYIEPGKDQFCQSQAAWKKLMKCKQRQIFINIYLGIYSHLFLFTSILRLFLCSPPHNRMEPHFDDTILN